MLPHSGTSIRTRRQKVLVYGLYILVFALLVIFCLMLGGRIDDTHDKKTEKSESTPTVQAITVPGGATVSAECVAGRGTQYILPKDIPMGPIYDVYQGKVVAVEYLIPESELMSSNGAMKFGDLNLPKGSYDHLALMPMEAHAGLDQPHFHAIAFLITKAAADMITCAGQPSSSSMMSM